MTMQMMDTVIFEGAEWSLCHRVGEPGPPDNKQLGITIGFASTACWRGRVDHYVVDDRLRLTQVEWASDRVLQPPGTAIKQAALGNRARRLVLDPPLAVALTGYIVLGRAFELQGRSYRQDANTFRERTIIEVVDGEVLDVATDFGTSVVPWGHDPDAFFAEQRRREEEAREGEVKRAQNAIERQARRTALHAEFTDVVRHHWEALRTSNPQLKDADTIDGVCPVCSTSTTLRFAAAGSALCYRCYFQW